MSHLIKKAVSALKSKGFSETARSGVKHIKYKYLSLRKLPVRLDGVVNVDDFKNVIVFENKFGWTKLMKQRPQQIAENLPSDTLMFYNTDYKNDFPDGKHIRKLKNNLVLIDLGYYRYSLTEKLKSCPNRFLMIYSTDYIDMPRINEYIKNGFGVIYEYVDEINRDLMGSEMYELLHERHIELTSVDGVCVVCTANELKNKLGREAKLITNGVCYEHFKKRRYPVPDDLAPVKKKHSTIVCYYGALASWFDYELIKKLAEDKDLGIVLIGMDYDGTLGKSGALDENNVYYLGRKAYEELPAYGCNSDILTIPFLINDITKATSPVKIFEYMAMEKPIVTTDLPECRKYRSVLISKSCDEFIGNVKRALELKEDPEYIAAEIAEAKENDWSIKAKELVEYALENKRELTC